MPLPHVQASQPARPRARRAGAIATVAVLALFVACIAAPAQAGRAWSNEARTVTGTTEGGGFTLRSERSSDLGQDELVVRYDARTATLALDLSATDPATVDLGQRLSVLAVVAFNDTDGDGKLSLDEPVRQRTPVPGVPGTSQVAAQPGGGWRAVATHTLSAGNASTPASPPRLELEVVARPQAMEGKPPTRIDLAWRVHGWSGNATHLALELGLHSDVRPDDVVADSARVRQQGMALGLAWQDGHGTVQTGSDARSATFLRSQAVASGAATFPAAVTASYTEADQLPGPEGRAAVYLVAALGAVGLIAIPAWRRLRGGSHG